MQPVRYMRVGLFHNCTCHHNLGAFCLAFERFLLSCWGGREMKFTADYEGTHSQFATKTPDAAVLGLRGVQSA